jgi:hypothetical protein
MYWMQFFDRIATRSPVFEFELITEAIRQPANPLVECAKGYASVIGDIDQCLAPRVE